MTLNVIFLWGVEGSSGEDVMGGRFVLKKER
jgi:hypothetical protein